MTIRAAMLGTRDWARTAHLPAPVTRRDVTVVACADPNVDLARTAAKTFGLPVTYGCLDKLDNEESLSLLVVAAPDDVHLAAIRATVSRGVAVFREKPLTDDPRTADALSAQASATICRPEAQSEEIGTR
jgi:predicted dehydrogenase